jgi:serine/threonine protein phosphatase PrpC
MQKSKLDELGNSLIKWSKVLGTEVDHLVEYILERLTREEDYCPDLFTTFCQEIGRPEDYKLFKETISTSSELLDSLKTKNGADYDCLSKLAELLDHLGDDNLHFIVLDDEILYTDGERFLINPLVADRITISDETRLDSDIQNKYMYKLPVSESFINYDIINKNLERYAFTFFLMELLFPEIPYKKLPLDVALDYATLWHVNFSPEYKNYISSLLVFEKNNMVQTCTEILNQTIDIIENSSYKYRPYQNSVILVDYGDRRGRGKSGKSHSEDDYEIIRVNDTDRIFVMIADGVSTADLGRGEFISGKIREVILLREEQIRDKLQDLPTDDHPQFLSESRNLLSELVNEINIQATEKLNEALTFTGAEAEKINNPMSSTILLGVVCGNWCSFAHLGDSEIIHRKNGRSSIVNLPHNVHRERILEAVKQNSPYTRHQEKDDSLTRIIPMVHSNDDSYSAREDLSADLDFINFALENGDMVFLATDGLLSCLGGTSLRWKGLQELDRFISENEQLSMADLTKKLLDHADKASVDDIAVVILKHCGDSNEDQKLQAKGEEAGGRVTDVDYPRKRKL